MRRILLFAVLANISAFLLAFSPACAMHAQSSPDQAIRASLDVLAIVIDPASQFAADGCTARKEAIVSSVEAHRTLPDAGQVLLDTAIERCNVLRLAFDRMRSLHSQASALVTQGKLTDAQAVLQDLREAWRGLDQQQLPDGGAT